MTRVTTGREWPDLISHINNCHRPSVSEEEVLNTIWHMKRGKAVGSHKISVEESEALHEFGLFNRISLGNKYRESM